MTDRPEVLFLAFSFPPMHAISAVRSAMIAKYLARAGWGVSVVTPDPSLLRSPDQREEVLSELDRLGVRRLYTGHRWKCLSAGQIRRPMDGFGWFAGGVCRRIARGLKIEETVGWYSPAYGACKSLRPTDVDVVLATGGPWGTFALARRLARRLGRPYVLDYRDPWTADAVHDRRYLSSRFRRRERRLLAGAAAVSVVSSSKASSLAEHFPGAPPAHVVSNGYDPDDFRGVCPRDFGHSSLVYAGMFLPPVSTAGPLLAALKRIAELSGPNDWHFHYYGPSADHVRDTAMRCGMADRVIVHGIVPRREALEAIRGARAAAIVVCDGETGGPGIKGIVPGKLFEPMGLGTPVLLVGPPDGDAAAIVESTGVGRTLRGGDTEGMAQFLLSLSNGWTPGKVNTDAYSWPQIVHTLDTVLRAAAFPNRVESS